MFLAQRSALVGALTRIVRCEATAEDLVQESYLRVARAMAQRPVEHVQAFLYQTARNLALDHLRSTGVKRRVEVEPVDEEAFLDVPSEHPSPEVEIIDRQRLALFESVLADLPARTREVLFLSRIHGWPYPRIAAHLGVSPNTVYNDIRLAMAHCLDAMARAERR
nr:sigma-70 family RNA polymerase sigma factor [Rhodoplanes tepidamans]